MKRLRNYILVISLPIFIAINACSDGNKDIPDLLDLTQSENAILNSFNIYVDGDTVFTSTMLTDSLFNSIRNDSVVIGAADGITNAKLTTLFGVLGTVPGRYSLEVTDSTTIGGLFVLQIGAGAAKKSYIMTKGAIVIDEINTSAKTIRGSFNVSNDTILFDKLLKAKAVFKVAYR